MPVHGTCTTAFQKISLSASSLTHRVGVQEDSIAVASGEYLDPRFDGVPTEWDESFDDLRSVEMDVALTLQVLH